MDFLLDFDWFLWVLMPLAIFFARIVDQSLGTLRIIFVSKSYRKLAAFVGFFESLIWLIAISQIIQNLDNWVSFIAFAGGFSMGNYVGIYLEGKLAMGMVCIRIITNEDATELVNELRESKYGVTTVSATGVSGRVRLILMIINRKDIGRMNQVIKRRNPKAFVSVEDIRSVQEGLFPPQSTSAWSSITSVRK